MRMLTGARPRRSWILLALFLLLGVAVSALFGVLSLGTPSGASERVTSPRVGALIGAKAAGWGRRAVRQAATASFPLVAPRCGALPGPSFFFLFSSFFFFLTSCLPGWPPLARRVVTDWIKLIDLAHRLQHRQS